MKLKYTLFFIIIVNIAFSQIEKAPQRSEGDGPWDRLIFRGVTLIDGTGSPAQGPMDIVVEKNPVIKQNRDEIEEFTNRFTTEYSSTVSNRAIITIPVVFHVVYRTSAENVTNTQIANQLARLNSDFAASEFKFVMAQRTPSGAATTGIERKSTTIISFTTDDKVKYSSTGGLNAWDATKYLNFWICNLYCSERVLVGI